MKKRMLITILAATIVCSTTACSNKGSTSKKEEPKPTKVVESVEKSTNDEEPTTSPTNEKPKDEATKAPATEVPKAPETKEPTTTNAPTTKQVEATKPAEETKPVESEPATSKPVETEVPKHTHNWKAVKATRTIKGYYKKVPITEEITKLEEYHDCKECGYIDLDEVVDLWNKDHKITMNSPTEIGHLFSCYRDEEIEPYMRKCIKKKGKADLSKHSIAECASGYIYDDQLDVMHDEEGYPLRKYVSVPYKTTRTIITEKWVEPKTEEYIDHYECSCGARK